MARMRQALDALGKASRRIDADRARRQNEAMQDSVDRVIDACFRRRSAPGGTRREREWQILLQRLATSEEIADAVLFLAASEPSYITGQRTRSAAATPPSSSGPRGSRDR